MKAETRDKFSPLEKFVVEVIEEKFQKLASNCERQFLDSQGLPNCDYHSPSIGYCRFEFCPRLRSKQSERGDENEVKHEEEKRIEKLEQKR